MTAAAVSVLMPVFNGEQHIREAIESILGQTYSDFELLVVDDHSTDSTGEIVREYCERDARIRAARNQEAKGTVGALNTGLGLARGEYLARMDADDISLPTRRAEIQGATPARTSAIRAFARSISDLSRRVLRSS